MVSCYVSQHCTNYSEKNLQRQLGICLVEHFGYSPAAHFRIHVEYFCQPSGSFLPFLGVQLPNAKRAWSR